MQIMYLHHILQLDDDRLVKQIYLCQKESPLKNDFVEVIKNDLEELQLSEKMVVTMSKEKLRKVVLEKLEKKQEKVINQSSKSKSKFLKNKAFGISFYLSSECKMSYKLKQLLFKIRNRMVDIKKNFKYKNDKMCRLGCKEEESLSHLIRCEKIGTYNDNEEIENIDIHTENEKDFKKLVKHVHIQIEKRTELEMDIKDDIYLNRKRKRESVRKEGRKNKRTKIYTQNIS